ncbi:YheT family hydrolase [Undibacterium sp. WLX3042]|uniref:YheT family hydrolase n=1 Tax=Undibacterium sp. WLX3042 TaxID=3412686 RepID=UPI003C2FDE6E
MKYLAPAWLPGGHLQTIYPAKCIRKPAVSFRRERWQTPDQDFIDVDFVDGKPGQAFVVLFHGLEGSSDSHYARALMAAIQARGWSGAIPHFRGCSGELNQAPRFYHSGDAEELDWIIRRLHAQHSATNGAAQFFAAGVSLGGNALLRWIGESQQQATIVDAACAVSAPLDLAQGGASLSSGINMLYTRMFLKTLKPKCMLKLEQFPGLFDRNRLLEAKNLYEFDNVVTAPLHGYLDTDDYWYRASAKHVLNDITIPTLVLNAKNDPFLPGRYLPLTAAKCVQLDYPEHGGHVGFVSGNIPGQLDWLPQKILHFFDQATHG